MEILDRFGLGDQPQIPSILHRAPVAQVAFQPDVPVPSETRVEHVRELVKRDPAPVPAVEELYLQPSEETLGARVARAAALPRHRPHDAVILAYLYPPGPAIVVASVAAPLGVPARLELGACAQKRRVRHLRARGRGDRPALCFVNKI